MLSTSSWKLRLSAAVEAAIKWEGRGDSNILGENEGPSRRASDGSGETRAAVDGEAEVNIEAEVAGDDSCSKNDERAAPAAAAGDAAEIIDDGTSGERRAEAEVTGEAAIDASFGVIVEVVEVDEDEGV